MKKLMMLLMMGLIVGVLSGCGDGLEDLLGKASKFLDEQSENEDGEKADGEKTPAETDPVINEGNESESGSENNADDTGEKPAESNGEGSNEAGIGLDDDGHGPDEGQFTTVADLVKQGVYEQIDFPNGWPLPIPPADWVLVQMLKDPEDGFEAWEGAICFDTEIIGTAAAYEDQLFKEGFSVLSEPVDNEDVPDNKHVTKFQYNGNGQTIVGDIVYYVDNNGNGCAEVYFVFE